MWGVNWWQRTRRLLAEYYMDGVRNCVVDCTCKSSMMLSAVLHGHRFGILPPTRNQFVLSAKSWNGFSRLEVSSRKEESNQPLGLFCDNQRLRSRLSDLLERRPILSGTLKLRSVIDISVKASFFYWLILYSFPSHSSTAEFALKITPHHVSMS